MKRIAPSLYPDAAHDFRDPGEKRQAGAANAAARAEVRAKAAPSSKRLLRLTSGLDQTSRPRQP